MASIKDEWKTGNESPGWREALTPVLRQAETKALIDFLDQERSRYTIYPEPKNIFRAFALCDLPQTRVVILGQDPYHGPGQAHGLSFSVPDGIDPPPSLVNIFKELHADLGVPIPQDGNLERWARQGVLLLNSSLTVRAHAANSHRGKGWERITGAAVEALAQRPEPLVFMLWGRNAQDFAGRIIAPQHLILKAPHPSPLSAHNGFFGCRHFSKANDFLASNGLKTIEW